MESSHLNAAEEFTLRVCQRSFLSLWRYANPRGKNGKELCDVLIVCDPHVIAISVKDVRLKSASEGDVHREATLSGSDVRD